MGTSAIEVSENPNKASTVKRDLTYVEVAQLKYFSHGLSVVNRSTAVAGA